MDKRGCVFKGVALKIAFFLNPSDEFISERLKKTIPWDLEHYSYQPAVPDSADESFLQWIGGMPEEPAGLPQSPPLNPFGRTGVDGRGRLPAFGENKAFFLVFTLEEKWDYGYIPSKSQSVRRQVLLRSEDSGENHLPWFLCNHAPTDDKNELLEVLILAYMQRMAVDLALRDPESYDFCGNLKEELEKCEVDYYEMGCLEDKLNCDNAWINVTAIHIKMPGSYQFWERLPQRTTKLNGKCSENNRNYGYSTHIQQRRFSSGGFEEKNLQRFLWQHVISAEILNEENLPDPFTSTHGRC
ncbi:unnamed protein product [Dibothriocephalus latus]|uniref:Uncharacterized protein n=1 Tax=Dibothriocephalus latus TaxID=60516 RepID=A0A3P6S7I8_DIBLA|nr:unnamed protein product [Dibothriocephalus latus]